jgi:hypothetical protein
MKALLKLVLLSAVAIAAASCNYEPIKTCEKFSATGCVLFEYCRSGYNSYWNADGNRFPCEDPLCEGAHSEAIAYCESKK